MQKRAIINFTKKCALDCEWCYVDFDSQPIESKKLISIIERLSELGYDTVTFGGGDPFQYKNLPYIIKIAKELGLFIHIDTHAITLSENIENALLLENYVDLIGLPLDGSSSHTHDLLRGLDGHYEMIKNKLIWLKSCNIKIKINTMVSLINSSELEELAEQILKLEPDRWSIYQFWPLGPASKVNSNYLLDNHTFLKSIDKIDFEMLKNKMIIEVNTAESRRQTYPILNHNGDIYFHQEYPSNEFQNIGTIFEQEISKKMAVFCNNEREQAISRYVKN